MKQKITKEQLYALSYDQREKLRRWLQNVNIGKPDADGYHLIPRLKIGELIQFLFYNDFGPIITSNDNAFYWTVEPDKKLDCWNKFSYENAELCDALWEAVTDILKL